MTAQALNVLVSVSVVSSVFGTIWRARIDRLTAVGLGAAAMLALGALLGFYLPVDALGAIRFRTLFLLCGMGLVSAVLDEAGFFRLAGARLSAFTGSSGTRTLVILCLVTYLFSLVINNLTTILVVVPMTIRLCDRTGLDPRPIVVAEIIASNLGGASSMVGDFPNMLISAEVGLSFSSFVHRMMPPCLILLGVLLFMVRGAGGHPLPSRGSADEEAVDLDARQMGTIKKALAVLGLVMVCFVLSDTIGITPPLIAMIAGVTLLLLGGANPLNVLRRFGYRDLAFFTFLFILVGGVDASGLLGSAAGAVHRVTEGSALLQCLLLMWLAAGVTALLNAGPTTALLMPIFLALGAGSSNHLLWWSLSLGVCAGSSATLIGATAGPVAATMLERHLGRAEGPDGERLAFGAREYARTGLPVALAFLLISSFYVSAVYSFYTEVQV